MNTLGINTIQNKNVGSINPPPTLSDHEKVQHKTKAYFMDFIAQRLLAALHLDKMTVICRQFQMYFVNWKFWMKNFTKLH